MSRQSDPVRRSARGDKAAATHEQILSEAVAAAREIGISALSIGSLAERVGMSKSGLFAHFGAKEDLQIAVLDRAQQGFVERVMRPSIAKPRGMERLRAIFQGWLEWSGGGPTLKGSCVVLSAFQEFDDRPGPVRDHLMAIANNLRQTLRRSVLQTVESGELPANTDSHQFAFELFGIIMAAQLHQRVISDPATRQRALQALDRLIEHPPIIL